MEGDNFFLTSYHDVRNSQVPEIDAKKKFQYTTDCLLQAAAKEDEMTKCLDTYNPRTSVFFS